MAKKHSGKAKRRVLKTAAGPRPAMSAVLNSLSSVDAQRGYRHAIEEFVEWYCSEPRLSFIKTVVLGYRIHLESRHLAPETSRRARRPPYTWRGDPLRAVVRLSWHIHYTAATRSC
jgi:hypothetical protein